MRNLNSEQAPSFASNAYQAMPQTEYQDVSGLAQTGPSQYSQSAWEVNYQQFRAMARSIDEDIFRQAMRSQEQYLRQYGERSLDSTRYPRVGTVVRMWTVK